MSSMNSRREKERSLTLKLINEGKINLNELYSDISGKQDT